jgi:hypothetical protein
MDAVGGPLDAPEIDVWISKGENLFRIFEKDGSEANDQHNRR